MRKGRIKFTPGFMAGALQFPLGWNIERIETIPNSEGKPVFEMIVSGDDFPEEPVVEGVKVKLCRLDIRREKTTITVKEVE